MKVALYSRISVSTEQSVSIERQIQAAEQYAAARGWEVVAAFTDDGVSASHNRPEDRAGWSALLESTAQFDAVIIWKIDRLARRITDFWDAVKALQEKGRSLVSIVDNLDMSTTIGQVVAGVLAGFAQMEAEAIRDRVAAARRHLLHSGRWPGGTVPYGWKTYPNPDGPGYVLRQDPDRIEWVRGMVERVQRGHSLYSVVQWLDEEGAPLPAASQGVRKGTGWSYSTVERLVRNPVLAGMIQYNPGTNNRGKDRGKAQVVDFVRDADGLPVVEDAVAIMPVDEWRSMIARLDSNDSPRAKPSALRSKTSALLSGLVRCGACLDAGEGDVRMRRGTTQGRPSYSCPKCYQTISNFEDYVIDQFLWAKGERMRLSPVEEIVEDGSARLPEIEHRLSELAAQLQATDDDAEADRLLAQMRNLKRIRREARNTPTVRELRPVRTDRTYVEDWEAAGDDVEDRRAVLDDALESIEVRRGKRGGRGLDPNRLTFHWRFPEEVGPEYVPTDEQLADWAESKPE